MSTRILSSICCIPLLVGALVGCQTVTPKTTAENTATSANTLQQTSDAATLSPSYWRVQSMAGRDVTDLIEASVAFSDRKVSGRAGCNFFFANYQEAEDRLRIAQITTSKKICFSAVMHQEQLLLKLLADAERFERDDAGQLLIYSQSTSAPTVLKPIARTEMSVLASAR